MREMSRTAEAFAPAQNYRSQNKWIQTFKDGQIQTPAATAAGFPLKDAHDGRLLRIWI